MQKTNIDKSIIDIQKAKDDLASLSTKKTPRSATSIIKDLKGDILKARRAGRTWVEISEVLAGAGVVASTALLSMHFGVKKADRPAPAAVAPKKAPVAAPVGCSLGDRLRAERAASPAPVAVAPAVPGVASTSQVKMDGRGGFTITPMTDDI